MTLYLFFLLSKDPFLGCFREIYFRTDRSALSLFASDPLNLVAIVEKPSLRDRLAEQFLTFPCVATLQPP